MKIYFCSEALAKQINITAESRSFGHKKAKHNQTLFLWPDRFHKDTISPQIFLKHKTKKEIEKLIIIDRIQKRDGIKKINGHINRSGTSFLIAEAPFKGRPAFPDMTKVYGEKWGETVITVGPERFVENENQKTKIKSEALAPIASLWHYLGVSLEAYGCGKNITDPLKLIEGINAVD